MAVNFLWFFSLSTLCLIRKKEKKNGIRFHWIWLSWKNALQSGRILYIRQDGTVCSWITMIFLELCRVGEMTENTEKSRQKCWRQCFMECRELLTFTREKSWEWRMCSLTALRNMKILRHWICTKSVWKKDISQKKSCSLSTQEAVIMPVLRCSGAGMRTEDSQQENHGLPWIQIIPESMPKRHWKMKIRYFTIIRSWFV